MFLLNFLTHPNHLPIPLSSNASKHVRKPSIIFFALNQSYPACLQIQHLTKDNSLRTKRKKLDVCTNIERGFRDFSFSRQNVRSFREGHQPPSKNLPFSYLHSGYETHFDWQRKAWPWGSPLVQSPSRHGRHR